jgi:hypothetical protein
MRRAVTLVLLGLAGCAVATGTIGSTPTAVQDWQTPAGAPPTKAEFVAVFAACQDKVKTTQENAPMVGCLADLGLRRIQ